MELKGKIIDFLGDSITEGVGVTDCAQNRYDNVLKRECGLKAVYNYGIGGSRIAHQRCPSEEPRRDLCFCGRAYDMNPDADIVVVYGGINDYIHGDAPIGARGDKTPATFCGAVWFLMNFLKNKFAGKTVVFMTPAHCNFKGVSDEEISPRPMKLADAMPVIRYVEIIKETGAELGVPVLDLFHDLGIDPNDPQQKADYTVDGLHFNNAGQYVLAQKLKSFLQAL